MGMSRPSRGLPSPSRGRSATTSVCRCCPSDPCASLPDPPTTVIASTPHLAPTRHIPPCTALRCHSRTHVALHNCDRERGREGPPPALRERERIRLGFERGWCSLIYYEAVTEPSWACWRVFSGAKLCKCPTSENRFTKAVALKCPRRLLTMTASENRWFSEVVAIKCLPPLINF